MPAEVVSFKNHDAVLSVLNLPKIVLTPSVMLFMFNVVGKN